MIPLHTQDLDATADRRRDFLGVGNEVIRHDFLGREIIITDSRIDICKLKSREAVMPGRAVSNERIPSFRTPPLGNAMPLDDEMRHTMLAEMLTHGQASLASTNNKRVYAFNCHFVSLVGWLVENFCSASHTRSQG